MSRGSDPGLPYSPNPPKREHLRLRPKAAHCKIPRPEDQTSKVPHPRTPEVLNLKLCNRGLKFGLWTIKGNSLLWLWQGPWPWTFGTGALRETGTFGMGAVGVAAGNTVTRLASEAAKSCTAPPRVRLWSEPKCGNLVRPQRNGHHLAVTNYDRVQCRMLCRARCLGLGKSRRRWSTANWRGRHRS